MLQHAVEQFLGAVEIIHRKLNNRPVIVHAELKAAVVEHQPGVSFVGGKSRDAYPFQLFDAPAYVAPGAGEWKLCEFSLRDVRIGGLKQATVFHHRPEGRGGFRLPLILGAPGSKGQLIHPRKSIIKRLNNPKWSLLFSAKKRPASGSRDVRCFWVSRGMVNIDAVSRPFKGRGWPRMPICRAIAAVAYGTTPCSGVIVVTQWRCDYFVPVKAESNPFANRFPFTRNH